MISSLLWLYPDIETNSIGILFYLRLKLKLANETQKQQQEVRDKYEALRELEFRSQRDNLERMKIDRELDRQKMVERKQLQQHL